MIVKNESKNVERLFNTLLGIIDCACITDTGSTDNTVSVIQNWFEKNSLPVTIHHSIFQNFGHNRTESITFAKQSYPNVDYFLLSDADNTWVQDKNKNFRDQLTEEDHFVTVVSKTYTYLTISFLKADLDWKCIGVTHEYWMKGDRTPNPSRGVIDCLRIEDKEDGGCKQNKFTRDEKLLLNGYYSSLTNSVLKHRYAFYLGQTYRCLKKWPESIYWYRKVVEDPYNGFDQELFIARYYIGINYSSLAIKARFIDNKKDVSEILHMAEYHLLDAYEFRKVRSEPLYKLCDLFCTFGMYDKAWLVGIKGEAIEFPEKEFMFVEHEIYKYMFTYKLLSVGSKLEKIPNWNPLDKNITNKINNERKDILNYYFKKLLQKNPPSDIIEKAKNIMNLL